MLEAGPRTSMREIQFINDNYYHIYNRGTDKRQIFSDNADYVRFIHYLYGFNDNKIIPNFSRDIEGGPASNIKPRDLLVEIVAFCLMPNHFHLILKQVKDGGITKFMRKLSTGYVMYFNKLLANWLIFPVSLFYVSYSSKSYFKSNSFVKLIWICSFFCGKAMLIVSVLY